MAIKRIFQKDPYTPQGDAKGAGPYTPQKDSIGDVSRKIEKSVVWTSSGLIRNREPRNVDREVRLDFKDSTD